MGRTVKELLTDLDAAELQDWFAYYALDPWDEQRADLRAGTIAAVIANTNSKKKFKPSDFMPKYEPAKKQTPADLKAMAMRWHAVLGGTTK